MYKDKVQGVFVHQSFFEIEDLSLPQKLIYAKICDLDNEKGCYASNMYFAKLFKISTRQVSTHINNLVSKGYVRSKFVYKPDSKEIDYRVLNTTSRGMEELQHKGYGRTIPISKDTTNTTILKRKEKFIQSVAAIGLKTNYGMDDSGDQCYNPTMVDEFIDYWTEPNKSNTKLKFELERTWDTHLRMKRWASNNKKWDKKPKQTTEYKLDSTSKFFVAYCDKCNTSDFYDKFEIKQDSRCCNAGLMPERRVG